MNDGHIHELMDAYLDQSLTVEQRFELEQTLVESETSRLIFWAHIQTHAQLRDIMLTQVSVQSAETSSKHGLRPIAWVPWLATAVCAAVMLGMWWLKPAAGLVCAWWK